MLRLLILALLTGWLCSAQTVKVTVELTAAEAAKLEELRTSGQYTRQVKEQDGTLRQELMYESVEDLVDGECREVFLKPLFDRFPPDDLAVIDEQIRELEKLREEIKEGPRRSVGPTPDPEPSRGR